MVKAWWAVLLDVADRLHAAATPAANPAAPALATTAAPADGDNSASEAVGAAGVAVNRHRRHVERVRDARAVDLLRCAFWPVWKCVDRTV